jgi:hypothetical protein
LAGIERLNLKGMDITVLIALRSHGKMGGTGKKTSTMPMRKRFWAAL